MKSTIITLIMLMCGFTVVRAQKVIITEEEINDAIKHIDYKKWLNVSFTGNKKWAI